MRNKKPFLLVILFPLLAGCSQWKASVTRVDTLTAAIPEAEISILGSNGSVVIEGKNVDEIQIEATVKAYGLTEQSANELLDQTNVVIEENQGVLTISADTPKSFRGSINFLVDVPKGLPCRVKTSNGEIIVSGTGSMVSAKSSNGRIELDDVAGDISAVTSNGGIAITSTMPSSIKARTSNGKVEFEGEMVGDGNEFTSSNGSINLKVSGGPVGYAIATSNGSVSVNGKKTKIGQISVDQQGDVQSADLETSASATIATSNGNISIIPN